MIPIEYPENSDREKLNEQRQKYGVSKVDVWWFDGYMLTVIRNGLEMLVQELHGWPVCDEFPTFESWKNELERIISLIDFCRKDSFDEIYDTIHWTKEDNTIKWIENISEDGTIDLEDKTDNDKTFTERVKAREKKVEKIEKEIWLWFSKWWHALWD